MALALSQTGMRQREPRVPVMIAARMRSDAAWCDVRIHNLSSRGMLLAADRAPPTGSYIELRRGTQVVVGRVMWVKDRSFGIRSQDRLPIAQIINEPRLDARPARPGQDARSDVERRQERRLATEHQVAHRAERNRMRARGVQFAAVACVIFGVTSWASVALYHFLAFNADQIGRAMGG